MYTGTRKQRQIHINVAAACGGNRAQEETNIIKGPAGRQDRGMYVHIYMQVRRNETNIIKGPARGQGRGMHVCMHMCIYMHMGRNETSFIEGPA